MGISTKTERRSLMQKFQSISFFQRSNWYDNLSAYSLVENLLFFHLLKVNSNKICKMWSQIKNKLLKIRKHFGIFFLLCCSKCPFHFFGLSSTNHRKFVMLYENFISDYTLFMNKTWTSIETKAKNSSD